MKSVFVNKTIAIGIAALIMATAIGCGSSNSSMSKNMKADSAPAAEAGGVYDYDSYTEEVATESGEAASVSESDAASNTEKRKLITNIDMSVETREFDQLITFLKNRTAELGGYVESESITNNSYYNSNSSRSGSMKLRVPEDKLEGFMNEVSEKSNIKNQYRTVTDVTLTYADLESHKKALQAEQDQLLALMEKAETIEEILQIQSQLTDVRYQIESMESQLRTFDNQINYSTIDVDIYEVIEYTPEDPVTFGERARQGFMDNLEGVGDFFVNIILAIITHIPVLVVLVVFGIIIFAIVKAAQKKNLKKRTQRMKAMMNAQGAPINPVPGNINPMPQNVNNNTNTAPKADNTENNKS